MIAVEYDVHSSFPRNKYKHNPNPLPTAKKKKKKKIIDFEKRNLHCDFP